MSVNKYQPHILVLPEDDANRQLANGFVLDLDQALLNRIRVLEEAGGWTGVLERFISDHVADMERFTERFMVLLIDFDGSEGRLQDAKARIPGHLTERVFILGTLSEPEALRSANLGSYEIIGRAMAKDCREGTDTTWGMISFDTIQASLSVYASAFARSYSSPFEGQPFLSSSL